MRQASAADAAALSLVASATFLETFAGLLGGDDIGAHCAANNTPEKFTTWANDARGAVTIAEVENGHAPVGYAVLTVPDLPVDAGPADVELKRIYTLSLMHGSGLGPALMETAVDHAVRLGRKRILLGVYGRNLRAQAFYKRQGFQVIGERKFQVGTTFHDDVIFARDI
ncbi:GNAT family N-acetyltransferase [Sphingomonas sp. QA11]|uniref:GNAT family N-acetyltransferase n=1 Tax=Sphingomonas sp. QA11 TaxID=2950605 RepID=UPI00300E0859